MKKLGAKQKGCCYGQRIWSSEAGEKEEEEAGVG